MEREQLNATLNRLLCLCRDGENGFLVAAENVSNRGLKAMLKTCALERAEFAAELKAEIRQRGGEPNERGSLLAALHRGWIDLKAAMTFGPYSTENVVLAESLRGERVALQRYQKVLEQHLPAATRALIERQHKQILSTYEQMACLLGIDGERLVVRLFDRDQDAAQARQALVRAGFAEGQIETVSIGEMIRVYEQQPRRSTVGETVLAAALLGAVVGGGLGALIGISMFVVGEVAVGLSASSLMPVLLATIAGVGIGIGILGVIGLMIGAGISEEDAYLYTDGVQHGHVLMRVLTSPDCAFEASRIMYGVNAMARAEMPIV